MGGGLDALFFFFSTAIQTVAIGGEFENLSFDAMLHADLHYHGNGSIL